MPDSNNSLFSQLFATDDLAHLKHSPLGRASSDQSQSNIYTVSRLNAEVRQLLESEMGIVWLVGELSNFVSPSSGHWYFSLKDSRAQVKCAMFKGNNRHVNFTPVNGNQVLIKARLSLYEPRGDYQLIAESMQPEGDGRLQQEFEQLKMKLASEGLFAQNLKQELPKNPTTIGIITSKTGAALYDILNVLKRRDPSLSVIIYPTLVQGVDAPIQIAQAIGRANTRNECDILIVGRGGGSLEDLWGFNNEIVARTIASSQIPIVSAVGHEVDVTIADFVADVRAPTPSAAAELVSRDNSHQLQQLNQKQQALRYGVVKQLQQHQNHLTQSLHRLEKAHPRYQLERQHQLLDDLNGRLHRAIIQIIQQRQQKLQRRHEQLFTYSPKRTLNNQHNLLQSSNNRLEKAITHYLQQQKHKHALQIDKLDAYSPLATLKRGYSITKDDSGKVLTNASNVSVGQVITTQFADGSVKSIVE